MAHQGHPVQLTPADAEWVEFETHPDSYKHIELVIEGGGAWIKLNIKEDQGHRAGYQLKLNSYDISVDVELADAVQRLRFEHPEVSVVVVTSALDGVFSSGANIFMLGTSSHSFKVNFCKYTNETRLTIEDASAHSGQRYIAALNGVASGGGYELPLACEEIYLVDDRRSAVSLPEIPYLAVLPGTGGLTRVVDKRRVRRDQADVFVTLAEGIKGKKAVDWGLVDGVYPTSRFDEAIQKRVEALVDPSRAALKGVPLPPTSPVVDESGIHYKYVEVTFGPTERAATLTLTVPEGLPAIPQDPATLGSDWWPLRAWRELDNALLHLRFHRRDVGLVLLQTRGRVEDVLALDAAMWERRDHWFVREVLLNLKRVLKRVDVTAKSFYALVGEGSCFAGSVLELALAADRIYMLEAEGVELAMSPLNRGLLPMGNGLTRMQTRFVFDREKADDLAARSGRFGASDADDEGLVTMAMDDIDWGDELRLAIEERVSMSPDALTGMEASIRFAGPETMETKIFGRLSAWQNWCFQRPNAVGEAGALSLYGRPERPEFNWERT